MEVPELPDLNFWAPLLVHCDSHRYVLKPTLVGRKLDMTSLTFCVGGPAGGGGGPGVADPVTMAGGVQWQWQWQWQVLCSAYCLGRPLLYSTA